MKLSRSTKKDVDQEKNGEDVPKLEFVLEIEVVLVYCYFVNNNNRHHKYYSLFYQINNLDS